MANTYILMISGPQWYFYSEVLLQSQECHPGMTLKVVSKHLEKTSHTFAAV